MISDSVSLMMLISALISVIMLVLIISFFKSTYFKDAKKSFEYPLFDTTKDLNNAIMLEAKQKKLKNNKIIDKDFNKNKKD